MNKRILSSFITLGVFTALFSGCCSNQVSNQAPLWASPDTIESVFPKEEFIARIGYAKDSTSAYALAESELSSYFSHSVHSVVHGRQLMTDLINDSVHNNKNNTAQVSHSIERVVTVEAINNLFDVHKTQPWYNKPKKQYVCCAYIIRKDAWKVYEGIIRDSRDTFRQFFDTAIVEKEPLRKIRFFDDCEKPAEDFLTKLENARLIMPGQEDKFLQDRKLAEGIKLYKDEALKNCIMFVKSENTQLERIITSIISSKDFSVSRNKSEATYFIDVILDYGIISHGETITSSPGLAVVIKTSNREIWNYTRNLTKQNGFSAAEGLIKRKILTSAESELNSSFAEEFDKMVKSQ